MDNTSEDFWVQYYDGSVWNTFSSCARGIDFENGFTYNTKVSILESQYNFPTEMKIRFMCDASGNIDYVYIDMIRITASTGLIPDIMAKGGNDQYGATGIISFIDESVKVYPNPANQVLTVEMDSDSGLISIYSMHGELMQNIQMNSTKQTIDISKLENGMYILRLVSGEEVTMTKFIKN